MPGYVNLMLLTFNSSSISCSFPSLTTQSLLQQVIFPSHMQTWRQETGAAARQTCASRRILMLARPQLLLA